MASSFFNYQLSIFQFKLDRCPAVLLPVVHERHAQTFGFRADGGDVVGIETTHQEGSARVHAGNVILHVGQQDVTIDVGYHYVEGSFVGQRRSVTLLDIDTVQMVQLNVFQRVAYAPVIDVYSRTMVGTAHAC